jgi:hypothetical protein
MAQKDIAIAVQNANGSWSTKVLTPSPGRFIRFGSNNDLEVVLGSEIFIGSGLESNATEANAIAIGANSTDNGNANTFTYSGGSAVSFGPNDTDMAAFYVPNGFMIVDGNEGANKVLVSDADGVGHWGYNFLVPVTGLNTGAHGIKMINTQGDTLAVYWPQGVDDVPA